MNISVVFSPPEIDRLPNADLSNTTCVVFDVLRATSTMLAAFASGAKSIKPVSEIAEAVAEKRADSNVVLAGERDGVRIGAELTGGMDFDLGNSPREMTRENVHEKTLVATTTNGTRAIRACAGAENVLIASFGNLTAAAHRIIDLGPSDVILVCSGTGENSCLEDSCGAGALVNHLMNFAETCSLADSAEMASSIYLRAEESPMTEVSKASNARRLLNMPRLADDLAWCLKIDQFKIVPSLNADGHLVCS